MKSLWAGIAMCLALVPAVAAAADPLTIFDIPFNQPLPAYPECPTHALSYGIFYNDWNSLETPCLQFKTPGQVPAEINGRITIKLPHATQTPMVKEGEIFALVVAGRIQYLSFHTRGIEYQTLDLDRLTAKFGEPTTKTSVSKQNALGATFDSVEALWLHGDGAPVVSFKATFDRIDDGEVNVGTVEGMKAFTDFVTAQYPVSDTGGM